jgi:hypothetical protein
VLQRLQELNIQSEVAHLGLQLFKTLTELTSLAGLHMDTLREYVACLRLDGLQDLLQLLHQVLVVLKLRGDAIVVKLQFS